MNFGGQLSAVVFLPAAAPPLFSSCLLGCLESLAVDTSVSLAAITVLGFDVASREMTLVGPASPADFTAVLRTLLYLNRAPDINTVSITLQLHDGVATTTQVIPVTQAAGSAGRRRRAAGPHRAGRRPVLPIGPVQQKQAHPSAAGARNTPTHSLLPWPVVVAVVGTLGGAAIAALAWRSRKTLPPG